MAMNAGRGDRAGRGVAASAVMAEINVTPMVDVMLVLLIIFMVSAPLLTVGVPLDLPQSQAKALDQDKEPLTISVNDEGAGLPAESEISRRTGGQAEGGRRRRAAAPRSASMCAATRRSITAR